MRPRSYREAHSTRDALNILAKTPPMYDVTIVNALRAFLDTEQGKAFLEHLLGDPQLNSVDLGQG